MFSSTKRDYPFLIVMENKCSFRSLLNTKLWFTRNMMDYSKVKNTDVCKHNLFHHCRSKNMLSVGIKY